MISANRHTRHIFFFVRCGSLRSAVKMMNGRKDSDEKRQINDSISNLAIIFQKAKRRIMSIVQIEIFSSRGVEQKQHHL